MDEAEVNVIVFLSWQVHVAPRKQQYIRNVSRFFVVVLLCMATPG